jgi:hypothetical protein
LWRRTRVDTSFVWCCQIDLSDSERRDSSNSFCMQKPSHHHDHCFVVTGCFVSRIQFDHF